MTQQEYDKAKQGCWENFKFARRPLNTDKKVFDYIFGRAYALGKLQASCRQVKEIITQEEIEKAAERFADDIKIPPSAHGIMVPFINGLAHDAYLQGAQDFPGKQEKDAEDTVISGWVARDKDGCLTLFVGREKPYKKKGCNFWCVDYDRPLETLPRALFPDLTWESEPEPVEIIIKRKKK